MWVILCSCFFAGLGFAVGEAVNDAVALNAAYQHENILERADEYFDPGVTLFTAVLVIVAMAEAGCFLYQFRLKRRITRATVKADATAREVANETRAVLARLNEHDLGRELWISIRDAVVGAPNSIPNAISFEPNVWTSTPLLRRPSDPFSSRTKFLIVIAVAVLPTGYFIVGNPDRPTDVAVSPQDTTDISSVEFLSSREVQAAAAAAGSNVEKRVEPEVQTASLQPMARLDTKPIEQPTESGAEARPPPTIPEKGSFTASRNASTCFPSASAVLQNNPRAWPSWTLRAPGHEGTRCWYAARRTTGDEHGNEVRRTETVQTTEKVESRPLLFGFGLQ
jgi:hypothetical protein